METYETFEVLISILCIKFYWYTGTPPHSFKCDLWLFLDPEAAYLGKDLIAHQAEITVALYREDLPTCAVDGSLMRETHVSRGKGEKNHQNYGREENSCCR